MNNHKKEEMKESYFSIGTATYSAEGEILEVYFPSPCPVPSVPLGQMERLMQILRVTDAPVYIDARTPFLGNLLEFLESSYEPRLKINGMMLRTAVSSNISSKRFFAYVFTQDKPLQDVVTAYLKLHLLSHRLRMPRSLNLDNIFNVLPNVVWTNQGPISLDEFGNFQWKAKLNNVPLIVKGVDKFPQMMDYVVPKGVRIANSSRVRLGAYLGSGTTVMHEGFVNFNAGTEGPNMIEGRISAGVWVKKNSDLGGGASVMGTLSGGGKEVISIGEHCLIGANAGIGISLGDRCTVEAGLYVTAGSKVEVIAKNGETVQGVKAAKLSGTNDLLFRRNSTTGKIQCLTNQMVSSLNPNLHRN